ncbi:MAG: type II toxin-antitoxin system RelE/ParE family toxin [Bacteroidales bacterium]|nr:type II toxin-antitoxin system RelE/ParE family toxin [Bacteroidales bacterium]
MKSGLKIEWSLKAVQNLEDIIIYLEKNWTQKEISKFITKFEKQLAVISTFPFAYPISQKKNIHRCVMSKNVTIYYIIRNDTVFLLSIFDTRQDPKKGKI